MRGKSTRARTSASKVSSDRRILGCVGDARMRGRLEVALRGHAPIEWFDTFAAVRAALERERRICTVLVGMQDGRGESAASFASALRGEGRGAAIVACCDLNSNGVQLVSDLAVAG